MTISVVGSTTAVSTGSSSYTLTLPVCLEDDVVFVFVGNAETTPGISSSGWSTISSTASGGTTSTQLGVFCKRMGATPDGSVTIGSPGSYVGSALAYVLRGVDSSNIFDVALSTASGTTSCVPNPPAITPANNGTYLIACGAGLSNDSSVTPPTGYSNDISVANNTGYYVTLAAASKAWDGLGEEDPDAWTDWDTTAYSCWSAATIAVRAEGAIPIPSISVVGTASNAATSGTSVTVTLPTCQEDDIVIVSVGLSSFYGSDSDMYLDTPGYTEVTDLFANAIYESNLGVFWKRMGPTPDTSVICRSSRSGAAGIVGVVNVFRGVDTTDAFDVTHTQAIATGSSNANSPSITPVSNGALIVISGAGSFGDWDIFPPSGYESNAISRNEAYGAGKTTVGMASKFWDGIGAEDPGPWTGWVTSTNYGWCAVTMALKPAVFPVATPVISPADGEYSADQLITIICDTPSSTIYYTEDGSTPTISSTEYTVPFALGGAKTIKAFAVSDGYIDSTLATSAYTVSDTGGINIRVGDIEIVAMYVGTIEITEVYLGDTKI